ncbi:M28 family peptidase [Caulobacter sp. KR2-114]|uniref:M28 family peptidase n=1 Tax=Caulobacter sp. KR2-114 TaxID=3400912 RepID=UPI003C0DD9FA
MRPLLLAAALSALAMPAIAAPPSDPLRTGAEAARDRALTDTTAYDFVESLTTDVGQRLAGTEASARARDWGIARLTALGFKNVHAEAFPVTAWQRGEEAAAVVSPHPQKLAILGLGGSVPTPPEGIEAEAVVFRTYDDLLAAPVGSLAGKIAIVTQPMVRTADGSGYGAANPIRRSGPSEAARRGAVAYLHRSLATGESRLPHTGALNYQADAPKIPAAALSVIDSELLEHMADRGQPIRIRLKLQSTATPSTAWTVTGEIPGSEHPEQVIIVGGHLDSWDPGTGAIDDGTGMAITVAAAHLAGAAHPPKRTIRVALFGAEEMDFSDDAFTAAHKPELANIVAVGESDSGSDRIWALALPAGAAKLGPMKTLATVLAPLSIYVSPEPSRFGGSDIGGLTMAGAPTIAFRQDASRYFDWHHSADDTLDKVDRVQLNQNVAAWAAFLYIAANTDVDLHPPAGTPSPARP